MAKNAAAFAGLLSKIRYRYLYRDASMQRTSMPACAGASAPAQAVATASIAINFRAIDLDEPNIRIPVIRRIAWLASMLPRSASPRGPPLFGGRGQWPRREARRESSGL